MTVVRPDAGEFAPFYADYIARVGPDETALNELALQRERVSHLLAPLTDADAMYRYAPDKWSVKEVVGHLADTERVFAYRLLTIARADAPPLPGFDENAWVRVAGFDLRPLTDLVADWVAVRNSALALVRGLHPAAWDRRGVANGHPISTRALFYIILGHVEHHCAVLRERYGLS